MSWLVVALTITACGGGGGSSDGRTSPPPGGGGPTPPTGVLWHSNYALDFVDGTQASALSGTPTRLIDADKEGQPWPDGRQYVVNDTSRTGSTVVAIKRTSDGAVLHQAELTGFARDMRPSPTSTTRLLLRWGDSVVGPTDHAFIDLATRTVLDLVDAGTAWVDWLTDGRYFHLDNTGNLSIGVVGGALQANGRIDLQGRTPVNLAVDPQGTRFIVSLRDPTSATDAVDLWIANIDGSNLARLTQTDVTSYGRWAPDGQRVAFDIDVGLTCSNGVCGGSCEIWHAPISARALDPVPASPGAAAQFQVRSASGSTRTLGCPLRAWIAE